MVSLSPRYSPQGLVLDTGLFIADERGRFDLRAFVAKHPRFTAVMTSITAGELLVGIDREEDAVRRSRKRAAIEDHLTMYPILNFDEYCAREWAEISNALRVRGLPIGKHDLLIAATALAHGYAVVTFNGGEFSRVPGLTTIALE